MNSPGEQYLTDHHTARGVRVLVNIPDGLTVVYSDAIMDEISEAMQAVAETVERLLPIPGRPHDDAGDLRCWCGPIVKPDGREVHRER